MEDISITQYKALCLLASGKSNKDVAEETGVTQRTIERWKKEPKFEKMMRDAAAKMFDCAIAELCSGAVEAAKELRQIIIDEDTPRRVRPFQEIKASAVLNIFWHPPKYLGAFAV